MLESRVRVIARRTLREYVESLRGNKDQRSVRTALDAWLAEVRKANWKNSVAVKKLYATASIVSADRIVFNIKGNAYRLITAVDFEKGIVWIKWVGTHAEYDAVDAQNVKFVKR